MTDLETQPGRLLGADAVTLGYGERPVVHEVSVDVRPGSFTVIVGPNGCGKSTLLRGFARLLTPSSGAIVLDGHDIATTRSREVARRLGLLPQSSVAPDGITVADLVARGRHPYQALLRRWSADDEHAVHAALAATAMLSLSGALVDELSGGQRQRAWVAMALAQQTELLLLDEPTTFLDIAHQYELMELFASLQRDQGRTLVAVLHDLGQACRYATDLVVMNDGVVVGSGSPGEIVTAELVEEVFGLPCSVIPDPYTGTPLVIPQPPRRHP